MMATLTLQITLSGFVLGGILGAVLQKSTFCTMGALADFYLYGDRTRLWMWLWAIAIAVLGANALHLFHFVDLKKSLYTAPKVLWLSHLVGGTLFGIGMILASGCGVKSLVRLGGGNLKSLLVCLSIGITALMTLYGALAIPRTQWLSIGSFTVSAASQDLPSVLAPWSGYSEDVLRIMLSLSALTIGGISIYSSPSLRQQPSKWLAATIIGLIIVAAWYVTGYWAYVAENPDTLEEMFVGTQANRPEALSFVSPIARSLELLFAWPDPAKTINFSIASVGGVILGSMLTAIAQQTFRWEGFRSWKDFTNHLLGGLFMGFGGITAWGCTVGQGISGVSTLAIGSWLTLVAICCGAWLGLKYLHWQAAR